MTTETESALPIDFLNEIIKRLDTHRNNLLIACAESSTYGHWDPAFATKNVAIQWENGYGSISRSPLDGESVPALSVKALRQIPYELLRGYGFRVWDETGLVLIPLWCWHLIRNGEQLHSITGRPINKGDEGIDLDHRCGMTAYGFYPE